MTTMTKENSRQMTLEEFGFKFPIKGGIINE